MSGNKIVKMFESIPQFDTFSKYNSSLERIFKNRSFKDFLHSLKNPTKFKSDFDDNKKGEGKFFSDNIDIDDELINEMKSNENEDFFSEKNDLKNKKKNKNLKEIKKCKIIKKKIIIENPDPFKYHPNYKAIYKYVPTVKFTEPTNYISPLKKKEKEFKSESIEKKKTKPKIKIPKIKESILITSLPIENNQNSLENNNSTNITTNNNNESKSLNNKNESIIHNSENQINKSKSQIKIISNNNNLLPPILKSNHALKFSQYTWRKNNIISKQSDKLTYLEPINYLENIDKILDFNKMSSRSEKNLINNPSTLDNPPICYYKPNYNFIERNSPMISFSRNFDNKKSKQFLLRKIWGSYNFTSEYQLVDNEKLNENKIE